MTESENSSVQKFIENDIVLDANNIVGNRLYAASWKLYLSIYSWPCHRGVEQWVKGICYQGVSDLTERLGKKYES